MIPPLLPPLLPFTNDVLVVRTRTVQYSTTEPIHVHSPTCAPYIAGDAPNIDIIAVERFHRHLQVWRILYTPSSRDASPPICGQSSLRTVQM